MMYQLLAQSEVLSGNAGVAGWSSFGIAGLVLAWLLLRHLPDQAAQMKAMLTDFQSERKELQLQASNERDDFQQTLRLLHEACAKERTEQFHFFNDALNKVMERHSKDLAETATTLRAEMSSLRAAIDALGKAVTAMTALGNQK